MEPGFWRWCLSCMSSGGNKLMQRGTNRSISRLGNAERTNKVKRADELDRVCWPRSG